MSRGFRLMAVVVMCFALLAGCSQKEVAIVTKNEAVAALQEYTAEKPLKISFWNYPNFTGDEEYAWQAYDQALIRAFESKYPNIKVSYQGMEFSQGSTEIEEAIQSQTNPDVIYDAPGRIIDWASRGYLAELGEMVKKDTLLESALEAGSYDGKLYLYPQGVAPFLMGFNKSMLSQMGLLDMLPLDKEDRLWSTEEFQQLLEAIHQKNPEIAPVILYAKTEAGDQGSRAFVSNLYGTWTTDDAVSKYIIDDENGIKAMTWVKDAYDQGLLGRGISLDAETAIEAFGNGNAAGTILYPVNKYVAFTKNEKLDSVFVPYPTAGGPPKLEYLVAGPAVFDNGDPDKILGAKLFIGFMINDPQWGIRTLKASGNFSAIKDQRGLYDDVELQYAETMSQYYGPYYNTVPGFIKMRVLWHTMLQGVLSGEFTPEIGLNRFVEMATESWSAAG